MGGSGSSSGSGGSSGGGFIGFVNSIPIWLYIVIAVVGLLIGILCFVLSGQARRRSGGGGGAVALGVISLLVLTVAPLVLMTIGLTSGPSRSTTFAGSSSSSGGTSSSSSGGFGTTSSSSSGGFSSSGGNSFTGSSSSSSGGGTLAAALEMAAGQMRSRLPMQSGPTTITDIQADGNTLIMTVSINTPIGGQWSAVDAGFRSSMCSGQMSALLNQGAAIRVNMTDSSGDEHTTDLTSC